MSKQSINAYLYSKDDPSLPKNHPKRIFMDRYNGYLNIHIMMIGWNTNFILCGQNK